MAATMILAGSAAGATTFGADLNRPADNQYACNDIGAPYYNFSSCSAESTNLVTGENFFPPIGEGTITRVRVKVGPVTGPMQIVVEEALRQDNPNDPGHPTYICCKAIDTSPVFTPAANSITTINTNLRVKQSGSPEPSGVYIDDHLALSVLSPNVPIPASVDPNASVGIWLPAWTKGEERAGSYGTSGATILFNADWEPLGDGGGGGGGGGGDTAVTLDGTAARVAQGKALLELACNLTRACDGTLLLQNQQADKRILARAPAKRTKTYAAAKLSIPAGKSKTVRAKLKRAGKRLLKKRRSAKVWLNVELNDGTVVPSVKVKLKRPAG